MVAHKETAVNTAPVRWEVQQLIGGSWENVWNEEVDGVSHPVTFSTPEQAFKELKEHLKDVQEAVLSGFMNDLCDPDEFRVVPVG